MLALDTPPLPCLGFSLRSNLSLTRLSPCVRYGSRLPDFVRPKIRSPLREGTTTLRPNGGGEGGGETAIKKAFTLAEVLITLVVIGVVAAVTVPVVQSNVNQKVKSERVSNIRHKFSKGTDAMLSTVGMNGYSSTMDFVQEFARHFKIAKICDNNHIADCWPTATVTTIGGEDGNKTFEWEISKTKTPRDLKMPYGYSIDWDDTVGIVTADGTSMILTYNKKCDKAATGGIVWSGDNSSSNTCVAAVFDWNGGKKPNTFGTYAKNADIYSINAGGIGQVCAVEANGKCFTPAQKPSSISSYDATYLNSLGIKQASAGVTDYWGGAAEMCGGVNNLPSTGDLQSIAEQLYTNGKFTNTDLALAMGISQEIVKSMSESENISGNFSLWSSEESSDQAARYVYFSSTEASIKFHGRSGPTPIAICLGG